MADRWQWGVVWRRADQDWRWSPSETRDEAELLAGRYPHGRLARRSVDESGVTGAPELVERKGGK